MNICNNFDLESHGCVPIREGFKYGCDVNKHGECLSPSNDSCAHYCDDAGIVYYDEEEFIEAFFSLNLKGYTTEELASLYNRIPLDMSHQWIKALVSCENKDHYPVVYEPLENLPLYINRPLAEFFKLFLEWRLEIGR